MIGSNTVIIGLIIIFLTFTEGTILIPIILTVLTGINCVLYYIYHHKVSIYTAKGAKETDQIRGFKKMLDDIGNFKIKDIGELIFWEDVMPYAVAFGLSKKVIEQLKFEFATLELQDSFYKSYYWYLDNDFNHFEKSFSTSLSKSTGDFSSYSGSSGGFSSGNSGGFGGGSGGGAF